MGWKGALRSMAAASRRAAREQERTARQQQRLLEAREKQLGRMADLDRAKYAVDAYENLIALLTTVHKECTPPQDWVGWLNRPKPTEAPLPPERATQFEDEARAALQAYIPSRFDKLLGREKPRRTTLEQGVTEGQHRDDAAFQAAQVRYEAWIKELAQKQTEWEEMVNLAGKVMEGDIQAWHDVLTGFGLFEEISGLGSNVGLSIRADWSIEATVTVFGTDFLPKQEARLTSTGKLSVKPIPTSRAWTIYQDHVCASVLRVARELFAAVPVQQVVVTAHTDLLNTATGHMETTPVVSVYFPHNSLNGLKWEHLDPSDALANFVHRMSFKPSKGFSKIEPLTVQSFSAAQ